MTYVDAATAPLRKNGQIKLHGKAGFAAMRKAGGSSPSVWTCSSRTCSPACRPTRIDQLVFEFGMDHGALPGNARLSRLPQILLHLDQSRRLPRHPQREAAARGRHRQHRRDADPRRLARRFEPHVSRRRNPAPRRAAHRRHARGDGARHRGRAPGRDHRRYRPRHPGLRRAATHERGARFLRPRVGTPFHDEPNIVHVGRPPKASCSSPACCSRSSR